MAANTSNVRTVCALLSTKIVYTTSAPVVTVGIQWTKTNIEIRASIRPYSIPSILQKNTSGERCARSRFFPLWLSWLKCRPKINPQHSLVAQCFILSQRVPWKSTKYDADSTTKHLVSHDLIDLGRRWSFWPPNSISEIELFVLAVLRMHAEVHNLVTLGDATSTYTAYTCI